MKQTRIGTFETNSSSSHSFIMCDEEQYTKLVNEELWIMDDELTSLAEIKEELLSEDGWIGDRPSADAPDQEWKEFILDNYIADTLETFWHGGDVYETFRDHYTTKAGETVYLIGKYYGS